MNLLDRLMAAVDGSQRDPSTMEMQIRRMVSRTDSGVGVDGSPFAPYKDPKRAGRSRPLVAGSKLIEKARVDVSPSLGGVDVSAEITGEAGKIAFYQNGGTHRHGRIDDPPRRFWGISSSDVDEIKRNFWSSMMGRM